MMRHSGSWLALALAACGATNDDSTPTGVALEDSGNIELTATEPVPTSTSLEAIMTSTDGEPDDSTGTGRPGSCGDGIVDPGEPCDDGRERNSFENACDPNCERTYCGDGKLQRGEACDLGEENSDDPDYNGCRRDCSWGPRCRDGVVQKPKEECEPGDLITGATCTTDCHFITRIIFLTSEPTSGAMNGLTGMTSADARCQGLAGDAGIPGTFKAWLMVDQQQLDLRFPEFEVFSASIHFRTPDNVVLAESLEELVTQGPRHAVATTEAEVDGVFVRRYGELVWTNITANGVFAGGDCGAWKQADDSSALVGHSGYADDHKKQPDWLKLRGWTEMVRKQCDDVDVHTYCIQVK